MGGFVLPGWLTYAKRNPNKLPKEKLKLTFRTPRRGEVQKNRGTHRPQRGGYRGAFDMPVEEPKSLFSYAPYVVGGAMLFTAFAFAGHQMGQNASAHNLAQDDKWADLVAPSSHFVSKGSLMPSAEVELRAVSHQTVMSGGKAAFLDEDPMADIASTSSLAPARTVKSAMAILDRGKSNGLIIEPAGIDLSAKADDQDAPVLKRLAVTPPVSKLEATFKLKRADKQKVVAQRRVRLAEERHLLRGALRIGAGAARGRQGDPEPDPRSELSQNHLRRRLPGRQPVQFLPVLLRLRRNARRAQEDRSLEPLQARRSKGAIRRPIGARHGRRDPLSCRLRETALGARHEAPDQDRPPYFLFGYVIAEQRRFQRPGRKPGRYAFFDPARPPHFAC
jgi:hypothetical protein